MLATNPSKLFAVRHLNPIQFRLQIPIVITMLWFFERDGERLQCEIRPSAHAAGFELEWKAAEGQVHVERSPTSDDLVKRWIELENAMETSGLGEAGRRGSVSPASIRTLLRLERW